MIFPEIMSDIILLNRSLLLCVWDIFSLIGKGKRAFYDHDEHGYLYAYLRCKEGTGTGSPGKGISEQRACKEKRAGIMALL